MWPGPYGDWRLAQVPAGEPGPEPARAWASTTSTSSTTTAPTRTRRSRRRWARSITSCAAGKALYAGISNYPAAQTREAAKILRALGTPCLIHQPRYNMLDRWRRERSAGSTGSRGRRLHRLLALGARPDQRQVPRRRHPRRLARGQGALSQARRRECRGYCARSRRSQAIAQARGQTLAQMALAWLLRHPVVASVMLGASRVSQIDDAVGALSASAFSGAELAAIDAA